MLAGLKRIICLLVLAGFVLPVWAGVHVKSIRMWPAPDNTRLVFDLSAPVDHTLFSLATPDRIVIDLKNARYQGQLPGFDYSNSYIKNIRYASRKGDALRFVLDLRSQVRPKSFVLKPHGEYGHRLVIDLFDAEQTAPKKSLPSQKTRPDRAREVVIAIDAGHGGEDPGALGRLGTREKDVVLAIARKLEKLVQKEPGMRPVMIRDGDYYVGLRNRVKKAREHQADLFISIHADAFKNHKARGSSVFVLSDRGASSEAARFLAESENSADMLGGVSLDDKDDLLKLVLVDMVKNSTIEDSHDLAAKVLRDLRHVNSLHKNRVEQAAFRVLKSPDVPSILVETAFISNPAEERKLRSSRHQQALAKAMLGGIRSYFRANPPAGTILAAGPKRHVISRGDTLSEIAARYRVSVRTLRRHNGLRSDRLKVGDVLRIPLT
ncbi:MAG: N-acetylmuramoyl-L-alanine amidase [Gammaproteobacteria bacterium]|nr:N-acetylmuramoyl-L-alanine amidase [Gammaproteobacteria bacterium]